MSDLDRGLSRLSYMLGEIIDPVGHAKDKARMRRMAALNNECPRCNARRGHKCVTQYGNETKPHSGRYPR